MPPADTDSQSVRAGGCGLASGFRAPQARGADGASEAPLPMADVLDQSEIDALLAASSAPSGSAAGRRQASGPPVEARDYDFKRPERVGKDHIRSLGALHEGFARNLGATLSGFLRTIIDVRVVGVEQLTYGEFVSSLPNPTSFVTLRAPPLEGQMCLELSPLIVYPILDRLLGGNHASAFIPQRPLTSIEWRLIKRVIDKALVHLSDVWGNLVDAAFEVVEVESNPQLVHVVAPTEVVVFITFEIRTGQFAGTMSLCIPFNVIEPVMSQLSRQSWFGYRPKTVSDVQLKRLTRHIVKSKVCVSAFLGQTTVKLSQLRSLRAGDLIVLDKRVEEDLIVRIGSQNKFAGSLGRLRGNRAVAIRRRAEADEPL